MKINEWASDEIYVICNSIDNFKSDITDINPPSISCSSSQQKLNPLPDKRIGVNSYYGMIEINKKDRLLLLEKLKKKTRWNIPSASKHVANKVIDGHTSSVKVLSRIQYSSMILSMFKITNRIVDEILVPNK